MSARHGSDRAAEVTPSSFLPGRPRQKVAQEREAKFRKLLESLSDPAQIKAIEPEKDEKLGTLAASLTKVLQGDHRGAHMAVKRGVIYISLGPIPGARRASGPRA